MLSQEGHQVLLTKEPGGSELGKSLRAILQTQETPIGGKAEFLLFAADRAQHFEKIIIPALREGKIIITDRCADSSLAYQGYGHNLDRELIATVNTWAMNGVVPDLIFYLRVDLATAMKRLTEERDSLTTFEKRASNYWSKVINGFETIFAQRDNVIILDASADKEMVFDQALNCLNKKLNAQI